MRKNGNYRRKLVSLLICLMGFEVAAQTNPVNVPSECEYVRHALDESILTSINDNESTVVFILRQGKGEVSKKVLAKRAKAIRSHLAFRKADQMRFIIAESDRTEGLGKLEIYVRGRLLWELFAAKNELFGLNCNE